MKRMLGCCLVALLSVALGCSSAGDAVNATDTAGLEDSADMSQEDGQVPPEDQVSDLVGDLQTDGGQDVQEDGPLPDAFVLPEGCCLTQADCAEGLVCVNTAGDDAGACVPEATASSSCWSDADCGDQGPCLAVGPSFQPLSVSCHNVPEEMGLCKGYYTYCCYSQSDCPEPDSGVTYICTGLDVDTYGGTCLPDPGQGFCYNTSDCPEGYVCSGGFYCACGFDCGVDDGYGPMTEAGTCVLIQPNCCSNDTQCPVGKQCVGETDAVDGVCKTVPDPGFCWDTAQCGADAHCEGAGICPCDAACDEEDQVGTCVPNVSECCFADSMCGDGEVCIGAGPGGYAGLCVEAPAEGQCWSDADCGLSETCIDVQFCGCGVNCPSLPGTCKPLTAGCCLSDAACADGETCVDEDTGMGSCLPIPEEGSCWDDDMCPGGLCEGSSYCPCGQACPMIYPFAPGQCVYPEETCTGNYLDGDGVGTPCPNGNSDCQGLDASICSSSILYDSSLTPFCTRYCNGVEPCSEGSFCIDKGWSSVCVPDTCADSYLASCSADLECVIATKWDQCCPCPKAVTRSLLATDPCMAEGESFPSGLENCQVDCPAVLCAECGSALAVHCTNHQCQAVWQ